MWLKWLFLACTLGPISHIPSFSGSAPLGLQKWESFQINVKRLKPKCYYSFSKCVILDSYREGTIQMISRVNYPRLSPWRKLDQLSLVINRISCYISPAAWQFCQLCYSHSKAVGIGEGRGINTLLASVECTLTSLLGTRRLSTATCKNNFKEKMPLYLRK